MRERWAFTHYIAPVFHRNFLHSIMSAYMASQWFPYESSILRETLPSITRHSKSQDSLCTGIPHGFWIHQLTYNEPDPLSLIT